MTKSALSPGEGVSPPAQVVVTVTRSPDGHLEGTINAGGVPVVVFSGVLELLWTLENLLPATAAKLAGRHTDAGYDRKR